MAGVLDYKNYIELFSTVKNVQEHFPSEQLSIPYDFDGLGSDGWEGKMTWQTLIVDQVTRNKRDEITFGSVLGVYPKYEKPAPATGIMQIPEGTYTGPMYPDRTTLVPVTLISFVFTRDDDIFSRQLLLIENWEPGMAIGDPTDSEDYQPVISETSNLLLEVGPEFITLGDSFFLKATSDIPIDFLPTNSASFFYIQGSTSTFVGTATFVNKVATLTLDSNDYGIGSPVFQATFGGRKQYGFVRSNTATNAILEGFPLDAVITTAPNPAVLNDVETTAVTVRGRPGFPTIPIQSISNTVTFKLTALGINSGEVQVPFQNTKNFENGYAEQVYTINNTFIPTRVIGTNYTLTSASIVGNNLEYFAELGKDFRIDVNWQSYRPAKISPGSTSTILTVRSQGNFSTPLEPLVINVIDTNINTTSSQVWNATTVKIEAKADLEKAISTTASNVNFFATYNPNYNIQNYILPTTPSGTGEVQFNFIVTPPKINANQVVIQSDLIVDSALAPGMTFRFPAVNGFNDTSTYTITNVGSLILPEKIRILTLDRNCTTSSYSAIFHDNVPNTSFYNVQTFGDPYNISAVTFYQRRSVRRSNNSLASADYSGFPYFIVPFFGISSSETKYLSGRINYSDGYETQDITYRDINYNGSTTTEIRAYDSNNNILINNSSTQTVATFIQYVTKTATALDFPYPGIPYPGLGPPQTSGMTSNFYNIYYKSNPVVTSFYKTSDYGFDTNNGNYTQSYRSKIKMQYWTSRDNIGATFIKGGRQFTVIDIDPTGFWITLDAPWDNFISFDDLDGYIEFSQLSSDERPYYKSNTLVDIAASTGTTFNLIKFANSSTIQQYSVFYLNGNVDSPTQPFSITSVTPNAGGYWTMDPAYTVSGGHNTRNYFLDNEAGRTIYTYANPEITNKIRVLSIIGTTQLILERLPFNLKVGATFTFDSYGPFTVTAIDPLRNMISVSSDEPTMSYLLGNEITLINPIGSTSTIFLGTATSVVRVGAGNYTWSLNRTLPPGTYDISAQITNNITTGTNAPVEYPRNSIVDYRVESAPGLAPVFTVERRDVGQQSVIKIISNMATSISPSHFYEFPNDVEFYTNAGRVYPNSGYYDFRRLGTSFTQEIEATFNTSDVENGFYAFWPGSLNFVREYDDQILFEPATIPVTPDLPTTTQVTTDKIVYGPDDIFRINTLVYVGSVAGYVVPDFTPTGTIDVRYNLGTYNYSTEQYTTTTEYAQFLADNVALVNASTTTIVYPVVGGFAPALNYFERDGTTQLVQLISIYSGDRDRASSSGTVLIKVLPDRDNISVTVDPVSGQTVYERTYTNITSNNIETAQFADFNITSEVVEITGDYVVVIEPSGFTARTFEGISLLVDFEQITNNQVSDITDFIDDFVTVTTASNTNSTLTLNVTFKKSFQAQGYYSSFPGNFDQPSSVIKSTLQNKIKFRLTGITGTSIVKVIQNNFGNDSTVVEGTPYPKTSGLSSYQIAKGSTQENWRIRIYPTRVSVSPGKALLVDGSFRVDISDIDGNIPSTATIVTFKNQVPFVSSEPEDSFTVVDRRAQDGFTKDVFYDVSWRKCIRNRTTATTNDFFEFYALIPGTFTVSTSSQFSQIQYVANSSRIIP